MSKSTEQSGTDTRLLVVQDHHPKEPVDEAVTKADQMQTAEIEATVELIDAMTVHAKTEEEVESNVKRFDSLRETSWIFFGKDRACYKVFNETTFKRLPPWPIPRSPPPPIT